MPHHSNSSLSLSFSFSQSICLPLSPLPLCSYSDRLSACVLPPSASIPSFHPKTTLAFKNQKPTFFPLIHVFSADFHVTSLQTPPPFQLFGLFGHFPKIHFSAPLTCQAESWETYCHKNIGNLFTST
ncbi:hypothetical protein PDJAM_G00066340 [Pangasius djambal]|uniref:Uncharacterized protein n=1 Tax=Pangasius djambal TaxID=1691987 RepID=A0ACC5YZI8_9TELE|nr:hypothetical protein [Pangasius djambal]